MFARNDDIQLKKKDKDKFRIDSKDIQIGEPINKDVEQICLGKWKEQQVAIKVSKWFSTHFENEWKIMIALALLPESSHYLITFYGYLEDTIPNALVMEYMDCNLIEYMQTLEYKKKIEQLQNKENPDLLELYQMALDTAHGIEFLHKNNFVHGDIKLDNIMLKSKRAKLIDFDHSCKEGDQSTYLKGTIGYQAPELLKAQLEYKEYKYTSKIDMFAYYVVLYGLFTTRFPYPDSPFITETLEIIRKGPKLHNNIHERVPQGIADLIEASSKENPIFRCSAKKAVKALEEIIETNDYLKP